MLIHFHRLNVFKVIYANNEIKKEVWGDKFHSKGETKLLLQTFKKKEKSYLKTRQTEEVKMKKERKGNRNREKYCNKMVSVANKRKRKTKKKR